jgi:hypothetical protein
MPHKLNHPLTEKFDEALQLASRLHREQARKGTQIPYISHVLAVSAFVLEYGGTETQAIAALLHDAVEDCGGEPVLTEIKSRFGQDVATVVASCTDSFEVGPKLDWKERKLLYLEHLQKSETESLLVVAADKLHNLMSIQRDLRKEGSGLWSRFNAGPNLQMWYYESVTGLLRERLKNPIVRTLMETWQTVRKQMTPEVVLCVGAEGGTLTLLREDSGDGWRFRVGTDETLLADDLEGLEPHHSYPAMNTWEDALAQLDRYQWADMVPLQVHHDYRAAILAAVLARLGQDTDSQFRLAAWSKAEVTTNDLDAH